MIFKSIADFRATLESGNLKPTEYINERRANEFADRIIRTNEINARIAKGESEFKQNHADTIVATSEMVHPKGSRRD